MTQERATLIYNPNARQTDAVEPDVILEALRTAGFEATHHPTEKASDLDDALDVTGSDLVVTAGGDGTVRAVATRLLYRNVGILPLPMGTANNIARSLGITGDPLALVAGLPQRRRRPFDVGQVTGPWGKEYFLEAMGVGYYADALAAYEPDKPKSVLRALRAVRETLPDPQVRDVRAALDGADISGGYLLLEVLNTEAFGPRLKIAPEADTGDGLFEVLRVNEHERVNVLSYVMALLAGEFPDVPSVEASQGERLCLQWSGYPLHIDGSLYGRRSEGERSGQAERESEDVKITVEVLHHALEFWIPREHSRES